MCQFFSTGKHTLSDNVPRTIQGKDINRRAVFACNEVGLGREGLAAICEVLDMPSPVVTNAWAAHDYELYKQHHCSFRLVLLQSTELWNWQTSQQVAKHPKQAVGETTWGSERLKREYLTSTRSTDELRRGWPSELRRPEFERRAQPMRQVPSNWKEGQITIVLHVHDL